MMRYILSGDLGRVHAGLCYNTAPDSLAMVGRDVAFTEKSTYTYMLSSLLLGS